MDWNSLFSVLIGGGLSLLGAIVAVLIQGRMNKRQEELKEKLLLRGFIQSIKAEITILWDNYYGGVGKQLESLKEGEPFLTTYPITQEYFTIYTNSSFLIGRIENEALRKTIVETYNTARVLIDSFRLNNELIKEMNQLEHTAVHSGSSNLSNHIRMKLDELKLYAPKILELQNNTKDRVENLLVLIEENKV
jgi:hypothetical protein